VISSKRSRPPVVAVFFLLVLALFAAACGDDSSSTSSTSPASTGSSASGTATGTSAGSGASGSSAGSPSTTVAYNPVTIKFLASGNAGVFAYAQKNGILEPLLAKVNAKIEWVKGPAAFSANLDAMKAGNINASQAAVSPIIGALISGLDFKVFGISEPAPNVKSAGIVATKSSGIKTVQDLVGKRVAVNPAAHGEYILLKSLEEAGIPFDKVTRVPIQPTDAAAAFNSGAIDAWATFGVFFTQAVAGGGTVVNYEGDLKSDDVGVISASTKVLEQNPAAFKIIVDVYNQLIEESYKDPAKFQNVIDQTGPTAVSGAVLAQAIEDTKNTPKSATATPAGIKRVQGVLDLFAKAGVLQKTVPVDNVAFDVTAPAKSK
jgi:sulfonate transport system substrate-binding protein